MNPIQFQMLLRRYFRKRRFKDFVKDCKSCQTILDIGGAHDMWPIVGRSYGVVILNIEVPAATGGFQYVLGSGCELPFAEEAFDLGFSNSAIEHVGSEENQFKFASEMLRVGKRIYCQTPSRLFPIDPHLSALFLHWLPAGWLKPTFLRYFTLNGWLWKRPYHYNVTWISKRRLQRMFPGCKIKTERFLLLPKSFVVAN
ncbi:MAG TPA: methyltransferase domain-containing protein [Candidatus Angelobacter sp.]|nr:methyltransferase domain-containing protein [Candidatus Angelobacter sp.]